MRRRRLGFAFLSLSFVALAACSSHSDPPDLASQLQADTGVPWVVYRDPRSNEVRFMAPQTPVQVAGNTPEEKARAFFARYRDALHASGQPDEIEIVSSAQDARGSTHIRFRHSLPGTRLPVFASGSTAHFTKEGAVYWLVADFHEDFSNLDGNATVSETSAKAAAEVAARSACGASSASASSSELGVFTRAGKASALAYRISVDASGGECLAPAALIDAKTGVTLSVEEDASAFDADVNGARFFKVGDKSDRKAIDVTPLPAGVPGFQMVSDDESSTRNITADYRTGQPITTQDAAHWDEASPAPGAAADAQFNVRRAATFLRGFPASFQTFNTGFVYPLSLDIWARVHANVGGDRRGCIAFTTPPAKFASFDMIAFGDADKDVCPDQLAFSASDDVVSHEVAHLVTEHTMHPDHVGETGAISESFSDVMAAAAEHAFDPNDTKNLLIGEDLFFENPPGGPWPKATRSIGSPRSIASTNPSRQTPIDHTDEIAPCATPTFDNDLCQRHALAGIPSRAFSLMVQGGTVPRADDPRLATPRPIGVSVGIGWEDAAQIRYWSTTGLQHDATFLEEALAERFESRLVSPQAVTTTMCAWAAVGVLDALPFDPTGGKISAGLCPVPASSPPAPTPPGTTKTFCSGKPDGFVCDPTAAQAIECKNSAPSGNTEQCSDQSLHCVPVSASDPTASRDADGIIVCE